MKMKKLFILLMLYSIAIFTSFAQDSVIKEELASVQVIDQVFDRTTEAVQYLAQALKVPAEHVYSVLVKQQIIKSVSLLGSTIFVILLCCFVVLYSYKDWKKTNLDYNTKNDRKDLSYNQYDLDDGYWVWTIGFAIPIACIAFLVLVFVSGEILTGFINPEYGAIKDILNAL